MPCGLKIKLSAVLVVSFSRAVVAQLPDLPMMQKEAKVIAEGCFEDQVDAVGAMYEYVTKTREDGGTTEHQDIKHAVAYAIRKLINETGGTANIVKVLKDGNEDAQGNATGLLRHLAVENKVKTMVRTGGGLPNIVRVLKDAPMKAQEEAAGALHLLSMSRQNMKVILELGGIPPLISLLYRGSKVALEECSGAIRNLALDKDCRLAINREGGVQPLFKLIYEQSGTDLAQDEAAAALQNMGHKGVSRKKLDISSTKVPDLAILSKITTTLKPPASGSEEEDGDPDLAAQYGPGGVNMFKYTLMIIAAGVMGITTSAVAAFRTIAAPPMPRELEEPLLLQ